MGALGNRHWRQKTSDGVIQTETVFQPHENRLYVNTTQPNKNQILKNNHDLKKQSRDHTKIKRGLRIPEEDFGVICNRYPLFIRGTPEEQQAAMGEIMRRHPEYVIVDYTQRCF